MAWMESNKETNMGYARISIAVVSIWAVSAFAQDTTVTVQSRDRDRTVVAEVDDDGNDWRTYKANELNFSFFGSGTAGSTTVKSSLNKVKRDGRLGAGLGMSYFFHRNIGLEAEAYTENTGHNFVDNADLLLNLRFPLGKSGVAPYLLGGAGRQFDPVYQWTFHMGGGLEFRFSPHVGIFVDGRYVVADETDEYALGRAGLRIGF